MKRQGGMKFFDRKNELELLRRIREESKSSARMTILKGRRRIDKAVLQRRAEEFLTVAGEFAAYKKDFAGLSLADM